MWRETRRRAPAHEKLRMAKKMSRMKRKTKRKRK